MLVVERWSPVVGPVFLDFGARAIALAERIEIVCSRKFAAAHDVVNMLVMARESSRVGATSERGGAH